MPVNNNDVNIENNNKISLPNNKVLLGVLLTLSIIIGGLCYYFAGNKKPSEQPVKEVIEENQETENNNKENIENQKEAEIIVNNEYIPVIDCLWLNILFFVIFSIVAIFFVYALDDKSRKKEPRRTGRISYFFGFLLKSVVIQIVFYGVWFILMLIFAGFSKIWDKEHSWWSNVVKGFLRNRIYFNRIYFKSDYFFWIFWLLDFVVNFIIAGLIVIIIGKKLNFIPPYVIVDHTNGHPENHINENHIEDPNSKANPT